MAAITRNRRPTSAEYAITDTVTPANSYTYGYDGLDRLTSAVKTGTTRGWTYDANGNRLTETGAAPSTYIVASANNRVTSVSGAVARTYTYDAAGNALTYSNITATYNNRGRMTTLDDGSATATYVYNALGERVKQSGGPAGTVHYVYDEAGHLIGEYDSTGALIQETIWLGDTPVATLRPGSPVEVFYVHTDHLNTPRKVTRPSDNQPRWTWESDPFGGSTPNENPAGLGTFTYNLRFPGQLYDSHGRLHYNHMRDYDPATGRYVESDPIGLDGGLNPYLYASGNPLRYTDPTGLQIPWPATAPPPPPAATTPSGAQVPPTYWEIEALKGLYTSPAAVALGCALNPVLCRMLNEESEVEGETCPTPDTHPNDFENVRGTKAKVNTKTGEVFDPDLFHKDHYEVYKNRKRFEQGDRDRAVWKDGRFKERF